MMKTKPRYSSFIPQTPFNRALKYLSFRPRSTKEMYDYLIKKKYSEEEVTQTLQQLVELHFLDDEDFARLFAESRQRKGKSKRLISYELKQKGIAKEQAEKTLETADSDFKTALSYIQKRIRQFERMEPEEKIRKITSRLAARGYNWDTISKVLKKIN